MRLFSALYLLLSTQKLSSAWVLPSSSTMTRSITTTQRMATVEDTKTTSTSSASTLSPEFEAALQATTEKLKQTLPEDKQETWYPFLKHFITEYLTAAQVAYKAGNTEVCHPQTTGQRILEAIGYGFKYGMGENKYNFDVSQQALRGIPEQEDGNTIDFYAFGCDFFRPCMDLENSVILGQDNLKRAMDQLEKGENVVLLANHQSEADPQVVSCMFEKAGYGKQGADMVYVAGHKVTTDPLAIPFSMGRNLICIHSKKHINADKATKSMKQKQNLKAMQALLSKFKEGGALIWVAPSGGRDRRNVETGEVPLAPFDSKTIDMFRLMGNKSKKPTHYYTMAMDTYPMCPPPDHVEAGVGEERNVRFVPVGVAMGEECESVGGLEGRHEFCRHAFEQCEADYAELQKTLGQK